MKWVSQFCAIAFACVFFTGIPAARAQFDAGNKTTWTLQDAIAFALEHNISIRQNELNARLALLTLRQSQYSQLPSVNLSPTYGFSNGRSIDPTTNQFVNQSYSFVSASGSASALLFGWFQTRNNIARNKLNWEAAKEDVNQLRNDVSLNVATGFLRALKAKEQIAVSEKQVNLSAQQLTQTQKFAAAGRVPELDVAQLEAQLAGDSATLIGAIAEYNASILDMKALLNLAFEAPFEISIPELPADAGVEMNTMEAENVYQAALQNIPSVRSSALKLAAAKKGLRAARGALYPQLLLNGQLGSNWTSTYRTVYGYSLGPASATGYVDVAGTRYDVLQPSYAPLLKSVPFFDQMENNFRQTVSATLNIPLFNAWQSRYSVRQAQINIQSQELNEFQTQLNLKQDVYKAHNDLVNALQKYNAAERAKNAAQRAFDFAEKRYGLGLTNTIEYLTTQVNLFKSEANYLNAKYDLIFKTKIIDYYLGKRLQL